MLFFNASIFRTFLKLLLTFSVNINIFAVELSFKTKKLEKQLTDLSQMKRAFGNMAKKVNQRMEELKSSDNVDLLMSIPAARCHQLSGDKKGSFAVDISNNHRLIFEPNHDPVPRKDDNSIDRIRITDIQILGTEDYH